MLSLVDQRSSSRNGQSNASPATVNIDIVAPSDGAGTEKTDTSSKVRANNSGVDGTGPAAVDAGNTAAVTVDEVLLDDVLVAGAVDHRRLGPDRRRGTDSAVRPRRRPAGTGPARGERRRRHQQRCSRASIHATLRSVAPTRTLRLPLGRGAMAPRRLVTAMAVSGSGGHLGDQLLETPSIACVTPLRALLAAS